MRIMPNPAYPETYQQDACFALADREEKCLTTGAFFALHVAYLIAQLVGFVAVIKFVCCDSACSRKYLAISFVIFGLMNVIYNKGLVSGIGLVWECYLAYEMMKLAKIAEQEESTDDYKKVPE